LPPGLAPPQPKVTLLGLSPTLLRALRRRLEPVGFELDIAGDVFAGLLELSTTPRAAFLFDASGEAYDGRLLASALRASRVGQDAKRIALNAREADVPELLASGATLALPEGDVAKTSRAVLEHLGPLGAA
jgi:DNA-binding response OmpR family regulator